MELLSLPNTKTGKNLPSKSSLVNFPVIPDKLSCASRSSSANRSSTRSSCSACSPASAKCSAAACNACRCRSRASHGDSAPGFHPAIFSSSARSASSPSPRLAEMPSSPGPAEKLWITDPPC